MSRFVQWLARVPAARPGALRRLKPSEIVGLVEGRQVPVADVEAMDGPAGDAAAVALVRAALIEHRPLDWSSMDAVFARALRAQPAGSLETRDAQGYPTDGASSLAGDILLRTKVNVAERIMRLAPRDPATLQDVARALHRRAWSHELHHEIERGVSPRTHDTQPSPWSAVTVAQRLDDPALAEAIADQSSRHDRRAHGLLQGLAQSELVRKHRAVRLAVLGNTSDPNVIHDARSSQPDPGERLALLRAWNGVDLGRYAPDIRRAQDALVPLEHEAPGPSST